jgi:hypothetical protein
MVFDLSHNKIYSFVTIGFQVQNTNLVWSASLENNKKLCACFHTCVTLLVLIMLGVNLVAHIIGDWFGIEQVGPTNGPLNYKELILELDSQQGLVGIFLFHLKMISLDFGVKMIKIEGVKLTFALFTQRE